MFAGLAHFALVSEMAIIENSPGLIDETVAFSMPTHVDIVSASFISISHAILLG